jgi:hypothetical protein
VCSAAQLSKFALSPQVPCDTPGMRLLPSVAVALLLLALPAAAQDAAKPAAAAAPEEPKPVDVPGFWTDAELAAIDEGLAVVNASRADLGFFKRPYDDPFRLDVVNRALDDPLSMGREAAEWDRVCRRGDPVEILEHATATVRTPPESMATPPEGPPPPIPEELKKRMSYRSNTAADVLPRVLSDLSRAAALVRGAFEPCGAERDDLLRKALLSQVEKPRFPTESLISDDAFLVAARKPDLGRIHRAGEIAARATATLVADIRSEEGPIWFDRLDVATAAGRVVIYGYGDDVHTRDDAGAVLVIDVGGDDTWPRAST